MICPKCKKEYDEKTKFCPVCGKKLVKEKKETKEKVVKETTPIANDNKEEKVTKEPTPITNTKKDYGTSSMVIGIVSAVLVFIFQIFIMPLAIVGLVLAVTSKKSSQRTAGLVLNIISLVIAIPLFILFANIIGENDYVGTWKCKTNNLTSKSAYVVKIEFKNNDTFTWSKYGDSKDNYVKGDYTVKEVEKETSTKDLKFYKISLDGKEYVVNGKKQDEKYKSTYETAINKKNGKTEAVLLNQDTYNMYYCEKD